MSDSAEASPVRLTVIVPATNQPPTLAACLEAIRNAFDRPEQVIVVEDRSLTHPALARNAGARQATGEILVFVDADVTVHQDIFLRIRRAFLQDPGLGALFGSYDDAPGDPGVVSVLRNLLHHHVHQSSPGPASTFWAGLGAIRRDLFESAGGFLEHPIEDIELGMRLTETGARIVLDPDIQGKHLKAWSLWSMIRTDLVIRGIPWVGLLLEHRKSRNLVVLNLGWRHRLSALASLAIFAALMLAPIGGLLALWLGLTALVALILLNLSFYRLLARRQGLPRAAIGVVLHWVHHLVSVVAVPCGLLSYAIRTKRARPVESKR